MKKKTVTLPRIFHPGPGHPAETLAYLNPMEHELIRQLTDGTASRGPKGVRSYSVTTGTTTGSTNKGGSSGGGGIGGGGQGGPGGGSLSAPNRTAPSSNSTSSTASKSSTATKTSSSTNNPTGGTLQAPARTAASTISNTSNTATGKAAQAAKSTAAQVSGTSTAWGGPQYGPGQMYSNASRSGAALNSVVNGIHLAGGTPAQQTDAMLRNMGYSNPAGRAGMLGTFAHESGFNPNAIGDKNLANHAYGLGQWRNDRYNNMQSFAQARGLPTNDLPTQAAFAGTELANRYKTAFSGVQNATNVRDAVAAMNGYERPAGWSPGGDPTKVAGWNDRLANAQNAFGMPTGTAVAGIGQAGLAAAAEAERAKTAAAAASRMAQLQGIPAPQSMGMLDPRIGNIGAVQGPPRPQTAIPSPQSMGMFDPRSAYPSDPRVGLPSGGYPASAPQAPRNPVGGMSFSPGLPAAMPPSAPRNPAGGMSFSPGLPAQMPPSAHVATDPRVALTPLGSLPAAKPKATEVAWNVPPMGGAVPGEYGKLFGTWGTNRPLPPDPNGGATPGTIHSQTADAAPSTPPAAANTSGWSWGNLYNTASTAATAAKQKVADLKADPKVQFALEHPTLARIGMSLMGLGGGAAQNNAFGSPQDRSKLPAQMMAQAAPMQSPMAPQDAQSAPMQTLLTLQQNMIAKGATPEELAYVQSLIDELSKTQVA